MLTDHSKKTTLMRDTLAKDYTDVTFYDPPKRARRVMTPVSLADLPRASLHRP